MTSRCLTRKKVKGQVLIEMIFSLIMFSLLLVAITSVSAYLYVQHTFVTAAREGARVASLNQSMGDIATSDEGVSEVQAHVSDMILATTGIQVNEEDIYVEPPDVGQPIGERSVIVEIDYDMTNPLPLEAMLSAFSGGKSYGLDAIPIHAEATMRYEE